MSKTFIHISNYDDEDNIISLKMNNEYCSIMSRKLIESLFHHKSYMQHKHLDSLLPSDYSVEYFILLTSLDNVPLYTSTIDSKKKTFNDAKDSLRH